MKSQHLIPNHIAIVMDGNGRWAKNQNLPRIEGHRAGMNVARDVVKLALKNKVKVITLFAFGNENWDRPEAEVTQLMDLFTRAILDEISELHKNNVRLKIIGDRDRFKSKLLSGINAAEELTKKNTDIHLNVAVSYSGRWDITSAMKKIAQKVLSGEFSPSEISDDLITNALCLSEFPEPDLFIRTSGEQRISNFLLWQLAYSELYFTDVLWPDFTEEDFNQALSFFSNRERRFGKTSDQLKDMIDA